MFVLMASAVHVGRAGMRLSAPPATAAAQPSAPRSVAVVHDVTVQAVTVSISNFAFNPANLSVRVGQSVTWVKQDNVTHDVTGTGGPHLFNSGPLMKDQSFSHTFDTPGIYSYICSIHPRMTGTVS